MVRIALGQINTTVGDLAGNVDAMSAWAARATEAGADLICFPELAITGYPPEDLVLRRTFVDDNLEALGSWLGGRPAGAPCSPDSWTGPTPGSTTPPPSSTAGRSRLATTR